MQKKQCEKKLSQSECKKSFYKYIGSKKNNRDTIGPLRKDGNLIDDNPGMSNTLNEFFSSVFTSEDNHNLPQIENINDDIQFHQLRSVNFQDSAIIKKIEKLKNNSAPGPDKIPSIFLKETAKEICKPLRYLFQMFLDNNVVPTSWKEANVTPIFKKGSKHEPSNYRPISLTSIVCKIMESIIKDNIMNHLTQHALINPTQHGFMPNKSCTTNLLEYLEYITSAVDEGKSVDIIYLDFAKAFDKVPHQRLLLVLRAHGIDGHVAAWIEEWLTDRKQRVVLGGHMSDWADVTSGVPQGSVLGPTLFSIYINTLDNYIVNLSPILSKFADDTKAGRIINDSNDSAQLQEAILLLEKWASDWQMQFNPSKCSIMHFGATNPRHNYYMYDQLLNESNCEKDVGVMIAEDLKPTQHVLKSVAAANQVLGLMSRGFHFRDKKIWIGLYKTYVRPHLEYAVSSWSPWTQKDINLVEKVQERAVNMCSGLAGKSYSEKLVELKLMSLATRRTRADLIQTWKILNKKDNVDEKIWFTRVRDVAVRETRASASLANLVVPRTNLEIRKNFFSVRSPKIWNEVPENIKIATSLDAFKNQVSEWLMQRHSS